VADVDMPVVDPEPEGAVGVEAEPEDEDVEANVADGNVRDALPLATWQNWPARVSAVPTLPEPHCAALQSTRLRVKFAWLWPGSADGCRREEGRDGLERCAVAVDVHHARARRV
jgi:hypothetical protein